MLQPAHKIDIKRLKERAKELASLAASNQSKVRVRADLRREVATWLSPLHESIAQAERHWAVGAMPPAMRGRSEWLKGLATPVAKGILRVAQLITRDQRDFNQATLASLRLFQRAIQRVGSVMADEMDQRTDSLEERLKEQQTRIEALEASLLKR